jgi:DNA-binding NarL/FixJ family response regulator
MMMPLVAMLSLAEAVEVAQEVPPLVGVLSLGLVAVAVEEIRAMLAEQAEYGVLIPQVVVGQEAHPQVLQGMALLAEITCSDVVMVEAEAVTERHLELAEQAVLEVCQEEAGAAAEAQQTGKLDLERQAVLELSGCGFTNERHNTNKSSWR